MKDNCDCQYCKNNVNEYFCITCKHNFNRCESFYELKENTQLGRLQPGIQLCPKCHPLQEVQDETTPSNGSNTR